MRLVLLGPPGAGKGTQATGISEAFKIVHISTGDIFRYNIKNETPLGKEVKRYLDSGQLVPDELTVKIVRDRLDQKDCENGFLLDGFPRTIAQAEALDTALSEKGLELDYVVNIDVDTAALVRRLSGRRVCTGCGAPYHIDHNPPKKEEVCDACGAQVIQRVDDSQDTVQKRIAVYEKQTAPLIEYYNNKGILLAVDGNLPIEAVQSAIISKLNA